MPKIRDIPNGSLFEYSSGCYAVKSEYKLRPCEPNSPWECIIVGSGEYYHGVNGDDDEVRVVESGSMHPTLDNLRCPECGEPVFFATILPPGWVLCRDMGHWCGPLQECERLAPKVALKLTSDELSSLIGMRPGEDSDAAIRRYVRETNNHYEATISRAEAAEQELKRIRKLLQKALGA